MGKYNITSDLSKYSKAMTEKYKTIGVCLPESLFDSVTNYSSKELITKSHWVRNIIFEKLKQLDSIEGKNG